MADNTTVDNGSLTDYSVSDEELTGGHHLQSIELHSESGGTKTKFGTTSNPIQIADAGGSLTVDGTATITGAVAVTPTDVATATEFQYFHSVDLDETEEQVDAGPTVVYGYFIYNAAATARFVKFYNATVASVTVGTTTPSLTLFIPPASAANLSLGLAPWKFDTALSVAATTGAADNNTGAPGASEVMIQLWYDS